MQPNKPFPVTIIVHINTNVIFYSVQNCKTKVYIYHPPKHCDGVPLWKHFSFSDLFFCCLGAPGAETGGDPEAERGEGLTVEPGLGGPGLVAPPRVGEMKGEVEI